jgi:hypothetical protein
MHVHYHIANKLKLNLNMKNICLNPKLLQLLAKSGKICWDITLNDLDLINMIFGAIFVFKISPNFAFKIIPEK